MNYGKFVKTHCIIMQLNHLLTDSLIDATPGLESVDASTQMMVQLLMVELEAVSTSVNDTAAFSGAACDPGGAIVVAVLNTGVFSKWYFFIGVLSSSSASVANLLFASNAVMRLSVEMVECSVSELS